MASSLRPTLMAVILLVLTVCSGCSVRQIAMDRLGDGLSTSGKAFAADDDPELIRAASPFSLKLMDSVLDERPRHVGLLAAAAYPCSPAGLGRAGGRGAGHHLCAGLVVLAAGLDEVNRPKKALAPKGVAVGLAPGNT